jgi:hypothetical protein
MIKKGEVVMKTLKALSDLPGQSVRRSGLLVLVYLTFVGCAQFQHQVPEQLPFMQRAQTKTDAEVRVTVAVPSAEESQQIFGFPLAGKNIQPVWLEVENNSDTGISPAFIPKILKKIFTICSVTTKSIGSLNPALRPPDLSTPT